MSDDPRPRDPVEVPFDEVIQNSPAVIYVKDPTGRYLYVNRQYEVVTGISSEEMVGHTDFDLFPAAVAAAYRKADLQTLAKMGPLQFEKAALVQGSERLFSTVKFPALRKEQVVGVCGISVDITDEPRDSPQAVAEGMADVYFGRRLATLTPQEVRVLDLVVTGLRDKEIAEKLFLSNDTVRHHVSHILRKLRKRRAQVIIEMLKRDRS